ncbi:MAG: hypothetical protein LBB68_03635 [Treponema sp.]|jgi:hypothetical protein|nr:hypothetical protein [Treponema sp.]
MKTKMILLCLYTLIINAVWAETSLDIESAVQLALEKNLSLERSRMDNVTAKRKHDRSWNSLIPSLGAGAVAVHPTLITDPLPPETNVWTPGFSLSASLRLSPSIVAEIRQTVDIRPKGSCIPRAAPPTGRCRKRYGNSHSFLLTFF